MKGRFLVDKGDGLTEGGAEVCGGESSQVGLEFGVGQAVDATPGLAGVCPYQIGLLQVCGSAGGCVRGCVGGTIGTGDAGGSGVRTGARSVTTLGAVRGITLLCGGCGGQVVEAHPGADSRVLPHFYRI